jgi:hypothetical protein
VTPPAPGTPEAPEESATPTADRTAPDEDRPALTRRAVRQSALAQAAKGETFSVAEAVGGPRGAVEAILPGLLFVVVFTVARDLQTALVAAVGASVLAVLARVVTRSNPTQAVSGVIGVAVCALAASRTGEAADFYAPGLLLNIGYALVYALSTFRYPRLGRIPAWGPFPVLGLVVGPLVGEGLAWRRDPQRLRAYRQVTWLWVAMFVLRVAVQVPLYLADMVGALGVARLVMGVPLFAFTAWLTWLWLRRVPTTPAAERQA